MSTIDQDEMKRLYPELSVNKHHPVAEADQKENPVRRIKQRDELYSLAIPIDLKNDNEGRSQHWRKANDRKAAYREILRPYRRRNTFPKGVTLEITRILGPRQRKWDSDSVLRGSAKELIDTLVELGWFEDDGPEFIASVVGKQIADFRHDGPAVWITVYR